MAPDQVLHYLLTECTFKIWMESEMATQQPLNLKLIRPVYNGGKFHYT